MTKNNDIRQAANRNKVRLWQVAEAMGIHEVTFSRRLRKELPSKEKKNILSIIRKLKQENKA